jgi:hypothetical protein
MKKHRNKSEVIGWVSVCLSTLITSVWAFWGIIENFHEGWYQGTLIENLGLMFVQYLSPMIIFMLVTLVSIHWKKFGAGLHFLIALVAIVFFNAFSNAATFLIILPLAGIGALYWFGSITNQKLAYKIAIGIPILTLIVSGIEPVIRVSQRVDDGKDQARLVSGNGVALIWAPAGPGWPDEGGDWDDARHACQHLSEDGLLLGTEPENIWRLPTVDETARSMSLHGQNSGGSWDAENAEASYETKPDKESPLWNVHSQVIYWWTDSEADEEHAFIIVYDGEVWLRSKETSLPYLGFRCVRLP